MKKVVAMVLAGGQGKRMDILCQVRPKPALPFAGHFRVIDFTLSNCINSGIGNISVLTDYQRDNLAEYLGSWRLNNPGDHGFRILEPRSGSYSGTADAVYQNLDYIHRSGADAVLVLAGDHVYNMDYRRMLGFHRQSGADVTIGVIPVPIEEASRFGIVTPNDQGRIINFTEKPAAPESNLVSMGIYIFNTEVLVEHLIEDHVGPCNSHDFGYSIIPSIIKRRKVFAYRFEGYWRDIGTIDSYYEANLELASTLLSFSLGGGWPVHTVKRNISPPRICPQGTVKRSLVSPGCVIEGEVENSILCPGVRVQEHAVVRNSIVMEGTVIGKRSLIDRCIVDEGVKIGELCYVGLEKNPVQAGWGITVVGKGVSVPPWTDIARNLKVLPEPYLVNTVPTTISAGVTVSA